MYVSDSHALFADGFIHGQQERRRMKTDLKAFMKNSHVHDFGLAELFMLFSRPLRNLVCCVPIHEFQGVTEEPVLGRRWDFV